MLRHGYAATSIDDICSRARVTKGSFYHFFKTKEEVALAVLNGFYERGRARLADGAYLEIADPHRRLRGFFDHLEMIGPELWRDGCLMGNFACEFAESSQTIRRRVAAMFTELVSTLSPIFKPIARDHQEADELAMQTLIAIEGAVIMARAYDDPPRIAAGLRCLRGLIEARITKSLTIRKNRDRQRTASPRKSIKEGSHV